MASNSEIFSTDWHFATENWDNDFHTDITLIQACSAKLIEDSSLRHKKILLIYDGNHGSIYFSKKESELISSKLIQRFFNDQSWRETINNNIRSSANELERIYVDVDVNTFPDIETNALFELYDKQLQKKMELYYWAWIPEEMHTVINPLDRHLRKYLISLGVAESQLTKVFSELLYCPTPSVYLSEKIDLQALIDKVTTDDKEYKLFINDEIKNIVKNCKPSTVETLMKIKEKYSYLIYHGYGDRLLKTLDDYILEIKNILLRHGCAYCTENQKTSKINFERTCARYSINKFSQNIFTQYAELGISKSIRRLAELKNFFYLDRIIDEMSKRTSIPENTIRFMTTDEFKNMLSLDKSTLVSISKRTQSMLYYKNDMIEKIMTGDEPDIISKGLNKKRLPLHRIVLSGMVACQGIAQGRARVVKRNANVDSVAEFFRHGDILITYEPNPDYLMIMMISSAIVTDQGGITCHASTIAREFNIPCIVGTQYGSKIINDGDYIQVNAFEGTIEILEGAR